MDKGKSHDITLTKSAMILISILLLILGLLFSIRTPKITAEAATEGPDSNGLYYDIDDFNGQCTISSCLPTVTSLTIPKTPQNLC